MVSRRKLILMLVMGVVYFGFDTLLKAGYFKSISNTNTKSIEVYKGIYGPEDMAFDSEVNRIYVSSTNRRSTYEGEWKSSDGIYVLTPENGAYKRMKNNGPQEFHPHGISVFRQAGESYLYAVNHYKSHHSIELFKIHLDSLVHVKSYAHDIIQSPNDVAGVAIDQFYVTNDHGNTSRLGVKIENYLRMPYSYLVYFDGVEYRKALEGLVYANGVQLINNDSDIVVSHTIGREVIFLHRNMQNGELEEYERLDMLTGVDNLSVDDNSNVYVAAHPQLLKFTKHAHNQINLSPSQVFKLKPTKKGYVEKKVFENDGTVISGGSVALSVNGNLFVGGVFDDKIIKITQ